MIELELYEFKNILKDMAELGAASFAKRIGVGKDEISQREAYRKFGEANVKKWVDDDLVKKIKIGNRTSTVTYSLSELAVIAKAYELLLKKVRTEKESKYKISIP